MPAEISFFNLPNILIMGAYFVAMLVIGGMFVKKSTTSETYFIGNGNIPSWAIGLSMLSASMSSITFLAMPAAAFALDWRMMVPNLSMPVIALFAIWLFIPFFRKNAKVSAYEYLFKRYGSGVRIYSSIVFLLIQVARLGAILYLLVIPLQLITGLSAFWIVVITGGMAMVYTFLGGITASIWADVIQAIVLLLGGMVAVAVVIYSTPGGIPALFDVAMEHHKFSLGPMSWDPSTRTFWTMFTVGLVMWTNAYTTDQNVIQRYLASASTKEARKATLLCAAMSLPTWGLFFLIGTVLFSYYQISPDATVAGLKNDAVFPHFILTKMPAGFSGLVIAGVISAAMGTIGSGLTAFSTVMTTDIIKPYLIKNRTDVFYTRLARGLILMSGLLIFVIAYLLLNSDGEGILDYNYKIVGLLSGVVVCFYLLGFFVPRVNRRIIWWGFGVAFLLNLYLVLVDLAVIPNFLNLNIHSYWVFPLVVTVMIVTCVLLAYLTGAKPDRQAEQLLRKDAPPAP